MNTIVVEFTDRNQESRSVKAVSASPNAEPSMPTTPPAPLDVLSSFAPLPVRGSRRARAVNAWFGYFSGPMLRSTVLGGDAASAAMLSAMRPTVNRSLSTLSPAPSGTRATQVRAGLSTLPAASAGTVGAVRGEWVTGNWVRSRPRAEQQILYYLHGSGYVICSPRTHRGLVARLSRRTGMAAFSLDYRLGPRHRFPAAGDDAIRGYHWLLEQGYAASNIVVAGDSAGGHLALDLLADNQRTGTPQPARMALFSPLYDPTFTLAVDHQRGGARDPLIEAVAAQRILRFYTGGATADDPRMRIRLTADTSLPDTLIQVGGLEVMGADAAAVRDTLRDAGAVTEFQEWPDQGHVFQMFPYFTSESRLAVSQAALFLAGA